MDSLCSILWLTNSHCWKQDCLDGACFGSLWKYYVLMPWLTASVAVWIFVMLIPTWHIILPVNSSVCQLVHMFSSSSKEDVIYYMCKWPVATETYVHLFVVFCTHLVLIVHFVHFCYENLFFLWRWCFEVMLASIYLSSALHRQKHSSTNRQSAGKEVSFFASLQLLCHLFWH